MPGLPRHIRAVTFDCWNTLIRQKDLGIARAARERALAALLSEAVRPTSVVEARAYIDVAWQRHVELWHQVQASGAPEMARWALHEAGVDDDLELTERVADAFVEAGLSEPVLSLAGAQEALRAIVREGLRVALICDTGFSPGRVVRQLLARVDLLDSLEVQIFSNEVGVPKPDPRPFARALAGLDVCPEQTVHIGDLRRTDVAGARGIGMGSIRIRDAYDDLSEHPEADAVADSHAHVLELLEIA